MSGLKMPPQAGTRRGAVVGAAVLAAAAVAITAFALPGKDKQETVAQAPAKTDSQPQTPAQGSAEPTFLSIADLPAGKELGSWTAQPGGKGLPDPEYTCVKGKIPAGKTTYRTWSSEMTGEARELVTVLGSAAEAKLIAKEVAQSIERCADVMKEKTTWKSYGHVEVADGLDLYGVYFAPKGSEYHLQLFGVGVDGNAVVLTSVGQMGKEADAPVDAFTITAKNAVDKAF